MTMHLFTAGDFHSDMDVKEAVIAEVNGGDYDLCLFTGDYHEPDYYEDLVSRIDAPFLSLTGNWDFGFEPPENGEYRHLYNYQKVQFENYHVVLLGAVYPQDFQEDIHDFFQGTDPAKRIVASHYPPHMLGDLADNGNRAGFPEFRELLLKEDPALWTCGHIHEDFGRFSLMDTVVLNTAVKESGKAWSVDLGPDGVETAEQVTLED